MKPNFEEMDIDELRAYVLENRGDAEAFYALMDRLKEKPANTVYPFPNTPEDLEEIARAIRQKLGIRNH